MDIDSNQAMYREINQNVLVEKLKPLLVLCKVK